MLCKSVRSTPARHHGLIILVLCTASVGFLFKGPMYPYMDTFQKPYLRHSLKRNDTAIHVLLAACNGGDEGEQRDQRRYKETANLLQTIQLRGKIKEGSDKKNNIIVHILTDNTTELSAILNQEIYDLSSLDYRLHEMIYSEGQDVNLFRACASARIYAAEIFNRSGIPIPEAVIYLDTDTLVTKPLWYLWNETIDSLRQNTDLLFALAPEATQSSNCWYPVEPMFTTSVNVTDPQTNLTQTIFAYPKDSCGYNTGVMVAPLRRWLRQNFTSMIKEQIDFAVKHGLDLPWGDQGILNAMASRFPERLMTLSCHWNYRTDFYDDCFDTYFKEGGGILHGNRHIFYNINQETSLDKILLHHVTHG